MKKLYETPSVEKITFCYRDQVVAASGGGSEVVPTPNPSVGDMYGNQTVFNGNCKYYLAEVLGIGLCSLV